MANNLLRAVLTNRNENENTVSENLASKNVLETPRKQIFQDVTNKAAVPSSSKAARTQPKENTTEKTVLKMNSGSCSFTSNKNHKTIEKIWSKCFEIPEDIVDRWVYQPLPEYIHKPEKLEALKPEPVFEIPPDDELTNNDHLIDLPTLDIPVGSPVNLPEMEEDDSYDFNDSFF